MKGFWRVLLVSVCGGLMALAALAGQVGYGDDLGRSSLNNKAIGDAAVHYAQGHAAAASGMSPFRAESL